LKSEYDIQQLVLQGNIVIAAGGGGIPVYIDGNGDIRTVEAVIDKDLASALLAASVGADEFIILTDVPYIYLNFKKPGQQILEFLDYNDTLKYLEQGMFGEGNMKPKIEAALYFLRKGGKKSIVTEATKLEDKRFGSKITMKYDPSDRKHTDNYNVN
jgi:carbamate kinase